MPFHIFQDRSVNSSDILLTVSGAVPAFYFLLLL